MSESNYGTRQRLGRRAVLRGAGLGIAGLAGAALIGCGGGEEEAAPAAAGAAGTTQTEKPSRLTTVVDSTKTVVPGGRWKFYVGAEAVTIDTLGPATAAAGGTIANHALETLFQVKPQHLTGETEEMEPMLAEKYEYVDPTTLVVQLRPNVKWDQRPPTNSRVLTSQDVKLSWTKMEAGGGYRANFANSASPAAPIKTLEAVDDKTVRIKTAFPYGPLLSVLGSTLGQFSINPKESMDTGPNSYDPKSDVRGTGPWMMMEWKRSVGITYDKNPNYRVAGRPYADGRDEPFLAEPVQQLAQFEAGNVWNPFSVQTDIINVRGRNPHMEMYHGIFGKNSPVYAFGYRPGSVWRDTRVRQAFSMLIDRESIQALFGNVKAFEAAGWPVKRGMQTIGLTPFYADIWIDPNGSEYTPDEKKNLTYNEAEAKKLIAATGLKTPIDQVFTYTAVQYGESYLKTVDITQASLEGSGLFKLKRNPLEHVTEYVPKYYNGKGDFDGFFIITGSAAGNLAALLVKLIHSKGANSYVSFKGEAPSVEQGKADALLDDITRTLDYKAQVAKLKDWQHLAAQYTPLTVAPYSTGVAPYLLNQPWLKNYLVFNGGNGAELNTWFDFKRKKELGFG